MPTSQPVTDQWEIRLRHQISRRRDEASPGQLSRPSDRDIEHLLELLDVARTQLEVAQASRDAWKREAKRGPLPDLPKMFEALNRG